VRLLHQKTLNLRTGAAATTDRLTDRFGRASLAGNHQNKQCIMAVVYLTWVFREITMGHDTEWTSGRRPPERPCARRYRRRGGGFMILAACEQY
jgi:hypothetical protein